jgi:hypothetical protein
LSGSIDQPIPHSRDREARDKADNACKQHPMAVGYTGGEKLEYGHEGTRKQGE